MNRSNEQLVQVVATPMARRTFLKNSGLLASPRSSVASRCRRLP